MKHYAFPSIEQFNRVIKNVKHKADYVGMDGDGNPIFNHTAYPTIKFKGTVKLHGCVHKDTLITLADGSKEKISDIEKGTSILSYNEEKNEIEFDVVEDIIVQDLDKCWVKLTFDDGSILKCTEDHPILTESGWIEAKDLEEHHKIISNI